MRISDWSSDVCSSDLDEPAAPGGIEVTVWDATEWSLENSMGKVASGAQVAIYRTQLDYATDNPLFEQESDAQGKVTFNNVEPGIYYIVATKGDMSNIFYKTKNRKSTRLNYSQ